MEEAAVLKEGIFVKVIQKIVEGKKERLVPFQGKLTKIKGAGHNKMITVKNALEGVMVERIFPVASPTITKIEILVAKKQSKKQKRKAARKGKK